MLRGIHRFEKQIINFALELMCIRAADTVMSSTKKLISIK